MAGRPRKKVPLRAVSSEDPPYRATSLKSAVESSERVLLVAMREKLAATMDAGVPPHTLGTLMTQLRLVDKQIRALDARQQLEADEVYDGGGGDGEAWSTASL